MMKILSSNIAWAKTYIHTQILTMMLAETLFRWYIRARIVSSSRMGVCNDPNEIRFTSEENTSCADFEYKEIKVEL